jgi:hypothetical protein
MAAQTMTERIRELGPNPLKSGVEGEKPIKGALEFEDDEEAGFRGRRVSSRPGDG